MPSQPALISQSMALRAIRDPKLYAAVPEFLQLRQEIESAKRQLKSPRRCGGCGKRKIAIKLYQRFVTVVQMLDVNALGRLKRYLGVEQLMLNVREGNTNQVTAKLL